MPKIVKNVVLKSWHFAVPFGDGKTKKITVEAESKAAALLLLPGVGEGAVLLSKEEK